jgi:hypothetical protein
MQVTTALETCLEQVVQRVSIAAPYKMGHPGKMWLSEICIFPTNLLSASYNFAGIAYASIGKQGQTTAPSPTNGSG